MMKFEYEHALIPSGVYVQRSQEPIFHQIAPITFRHPESPLSTLTIELCNPMPVRPVQAVVVQEVRSSFAAEFERAMHRVPVIGVGELYTYAEQLLELGRTLAAFPYDVVIIPLRGGLKPWLQLDVLREFQQAPLWLPYTAGSQQTNDEQIFHILDNCLKLHDAVANLRIAVIDTAISGDGASHLADVLSQCHARDLKRQWQCDFHLLHATHRYPTRVGEIQSFQHENLTFRVRTWPVDHLLVEDWSEAIGLKVQWEGDQQAIIKHCSTEGQLLLRRSDGSVQLIESPELHHYIDVLLGDAVSEHVIHDPFLKYQGDVWDRYITR